VRRVAGGARGDSPPIRRVALGARLLIGCVALGPALLTGCVAPGGAPSTHAVSSPAGSDVAIWVYGAQSWSAGESAAQLARLPGGARRLYMSVEQGPGLVVDDPSGSARLADVLAVAGRAGLRVEAMLLQDPSWIDRPDDAAARVARTIAFDRAQRAAGGTGLAGLHFDIEPHAQEAWVCGDLAARRDMIHRLQTVFARIARVRDEAGAPRLPLSAALPWWLGPLSSEIPAAAPSMFLAHLDELVLMVYGDPGGPLAGESAGAVMAKVADTRLWARLPPERSVRIGLATYEYQDEASLDAAIRDLTAHLAPRPGFGGTAIFALDHPFAARLEVTIEGRVRDRAGRDISGATVRAPGHTTRANRCGLFALKAALPPSITLTVEADGFSPVELPVSGLVPGRQTTVPPVTLHRGP
jgi:hypothetical protein